LSALHIQRKVSKLQPWKGGWAEGGALNARTRIWLFFCREW
jgi:hypothetical protein